MEGERRIIDKDAAKEMVKSGRYWSIVPLALEWRYVLQQIINDYFQPPLGKSDLIIMFPFEDNEQPLFLLARNRVPIAVMSRRFGADFAQYSPDKMIVLDPMLEHPVEPNVAYWGRA